MGQLGLFGTVDVAILGFALPVVNDGGCVKLIGVPGLETNHNFRVHSRAFQEVVQ
ncbi:MAG: hypothetical protein VYA78_03210 [Chloroflexota bacterium]|nr:hypothetical protein [Chloroflexota bacterium]|tara:strand:- start:64 stop:228 length:165 start_codon:yes stop_codon:yes gene_type:complete